MARINVRSPFYVSINTASASVGYVTLAIKVWSGAIGSIPATAQYNLKKFKVSDIISFEISELIKDYIDIAFDGDYLGQANYVNTSIASFDSSNTQISSISGTSLAFDSYSYFEEPLFDINDTSLMITNREVFPLADNAFRIPIYTGLAPTLTFFKNNEEISTQTFSSTTNSTTQIKYVSIYGTSVTYDTYAERVVEDGGTFEDSTCLRSFLSTVEIGEFDKIQISDIKGTSIIKVTTIEECKHEPKKVTFINKFGALQDVYFFKKSVEKMTIEKESYKSNTINSENNTYNTSHHVNRDFNVVGNESITLSSGLLNEEYNEVFKQMMLSEKCWITNVKQGVEQVLPINVRTGNITYKTSLNDKLVDYTFDFDYSFNTINNIR
jgi:hypothetical protein